MQTADGGTRPSAVKRETTMSRRAGPSLAVDRTGQYEAVLDRGCFVSSRCTSCPLCVCVKEMRAAERGEFTAAWRTIARYMAPPDQTIEA